MLGWRGFAPARRGTFVSAKVPKTISALAWPSGSPAMLANSGGCATRSEVNSDLFAQTVLAESLESASLLGHARRREFLS